MYYTAADALTHAKAPYHGAFIFLHPPVIAVVGVPFALLGRATTDQNGFLWENVAFCVLSAVNVALVIKVGRTCGLGRRQAAIGALFYAVWSVSVNASSVVRLEPLGDFFLLLALGALARARTQVAPARTLVLCGLWCGLLINVKIWWIVPVVVVLVWTASESRSWRFAFIPAVAAAAISVVIDLPFLIVAGSRMYRSIVSDQIGRSDIQLTPDLKFERLPPLTRLEQLTGSNSVANAFHVVYEGSESTLVAIVTVGFCIIFFIMCILAWRSAQGRVYVALAACQIALLLSAPFYYPFYGDYVAVSVSLILAAALGTKAASPLRTVLAVVWYGSAIVALLVTFAAQGWAAVPHRAEAVTRSAHLRCIASDPSDLIILDALNRSFAPGCRDFVDFQGLGHGGGSNPAVYLDVTKASPAYRRIVFRYFDSADAFLISNNTKRALGKKTYARLRRHHVLVVTGGLYIWVKTSTVN